MYYIYMLRCKDDSIYTGITTDLDRRMEEHFGAGEKSAKYTRSHVALKLEAAWQTENKALASKLEYWIKQLSKAQKEILIKDDTRMDSIMGDRIDVKKYSKKC